MIRCCITTASSGYLPEADSAESMTASAPSKIALAMSLASARVGMGLSIMLSSICVATITGLPCRRHSAMISRWTMGTHSIAISTPRSPRATMQPSDAAMTAARSLTADGFSIFAMILARPLTSSRSSSISSARCTKLRATQSTSISSACTRSSRSLGVSGEMGRTIEGVLTPLRSESLPPTSTRHVTCSADAVLTVMRSLPSSSRT
mmetsp:Transcript_36159/g.85607  ORF Transcript_36159/g.85607 Transcript_36159/m.85607 type:complete len:207 (-) Transcript_36159:52-672(-)